MIGYLLFFDVFLLVLTAIVAIAVIEMRDLFASVMLAGMYSLLMALVWVNMHAVDVAFTEAAVGAGISSILLIGTLVICGTKEKKMPRVNVLGLLVVLCTGAALMYGTRDMPAFADANAPLHQYRARQIFEQNVGKVPGHPLFVKDDAVHNDALHDDADAGAHADDHSGHDSGHHIEDDFAGHVPNAVTSLLADYRSLDTMFEVAVILTAGIGMLILLRRREDDPGPKDRSAPENKTAQHTDEVQS